MKFQQHTEPRQNLVANIIVNFPLVTLVTLLVLTSLLLSQTSCTNTPPSDSSSRVTTLLIKDVDGYTPTQQGHRTFKAILIQGDRVLALDPDANMLTKYPNLKVVSGSGHMLLPGLIDAHGHVSLFGLAQLQVDLVGTKSLSDAVQLIADFARENPSLPWILGRGWNQEIWDGDGSMPESVDLEAVNDERPIWLQRVDGHAGWANKTALRLAEINTFTRDPDGGYIVRDKNGQPTGVMVDAAMQLIERIVPKPGQSILHQSIFLAQQKLLAAGITSVHDAGVNDEVLAVYKDMAESGELKMRVSVMLEGIDMLNQHPKPWNLGRLQVGAVKIYADGALGSRGAALLEPYEDASHSGLLFSDQQALTDMIKKANKQGFQVSIHAIGTLANRVVLDAMATAQNNNPKMYRNRIEHAQIIHPDDLPKFARYKIIASMQPTHATSDWSMAIKRLGRRHLTGAYAWRELLESGARLALGSDFPVEPINPMFGLHAAITRRDRNGQPPSGWLPHEALDIHEAIRGFTLDAAYAGHNETQTGSLEPGKYADFILVAGDLIHLAKHAPDFIPKVRVSETWINGVQVYSQ